MTAIGYKIKYVTGDSRQLEPSRTLEKGKSYRIGSRSSYRELEANSRKEGNNQFLLCNDYFKHISIVEMSSENGTMLLDYKSELKATKQPLAKKHAFYCFEK